LNISFGNIGNIDSGDGTIRMSYWW